MRGVEVAPGAVLLGKYRVDDVLGVGGMGKVVRAWHLLLEQHVAIKILLPHVADNEATVQRFLREAQATVRLRSEHIARVMDVATLYDGTPMMVMEYLEGDDLNQIVRAHGPQEPFVVVDLMLQACEGIAEAHAAGIVHRDIKPSNFFMTRRPDGSQLLKILDFGISKSPVGWSDLTGTQTVVGTPSYMAPEQMKSAKDTDARSDVWSMGVVMYQLLAGRPPFAGDSYAELVLAVTSSPPAPLQFPLPGGLGEVIWRCLEKDPAMRMQSVADLAKQLAPYASDPGAGAAAADRAQRILSVRMSAQSGRLRSEGGSPLPERLTPQPLSWQRTGNSSLSHGAGQQVTHQVSGKRGWLIAGAASVAIVAGVGGWVIAQLGHKSGPPPTPAAATQALTAAPTATPTPTPTPTPTEPPPTPTVPVPAVVIDAAVVPATPPPPPPIDAAVVHAVPPLPDAAVQVAQPKPTPKPKPADTADETAKPKPKPHPKPHNDDGLFDSRH
jgi:serine/threonine-protein kinase